MALATNTLQTIRTKIRRLTRSPSTNQISDADIDQYINTSIAYDLPEHLRLFDLHSTFSFYLSPNIDTYPLTPIATTDPLFNFKNLYVNMSQPVYIAGYLSLFTQDPKDLFQQYPQVLTIASIGVKGNGTTTTFTGTLNNQGTTSTSSASSSKSPILQSTVTTPVPNTGTPQQYNWGRVLFSTNDNYNNVLSLIDCPVSGPFQAPQPQYPIPAGIIPGYPLPTVSPAGLTTNGNWGILFNPILGPASWDGSSFINYITGQYSVTFSNPAGNPTAPGNNVTINSQTYPYVPSRPQMMMFYNDMLTFRPVPDQAYIVSFEVYSRPTQLIAANQVPDIEQWWQYIAYLAAKKILEDRMDMDTVQMIMPELKEQETLVQRKTLVQNANVRTSTIYVTTNGMFGYGSGWNSNGF